MSANNIENSGGQAANGENQAVAQPHGRIRKKLKMVNLSASDLARQNYQHAIDRFEELGPDLRNRVDDHRALVANAAQALTDAIGDGSREVCEERLNTIKEFERDRDTALARYFDLKQASDDAQVQLDELNQNTIDHAAWARDRDSLATRLRGGECTQMAILLSHNQVLDLFRRFKRVYDQGHDMSGVVDKFIAGLSHFSKLKVLARMAYFDNKRANDMRANLKKEAIAADVLNDQARTLVTLRQGIKARTTASLADREQLIAWDIENRISIFMLAAAEESGGTLPENFDQWAEDTGDHQAASPRGEKRKRKDAYANVSRDLMNENQGLSGSFKPGNIKEMATQGRVIYNFLKPYGRHWSKVLPLADFCKEVDSVSHNSVLKVPAYIWKTLETCLQMTEDLNAMFKDICRDPDAWKARNTADMANARAAYYTPGSNPAWGFGVDNGRRACQWTAQPGSNDQLHVTHKEVIAVVRKLEPGDGFKAEPSIETWTNAMKVICTKEIGAFDIQMTQNDHDQYWRFEWLQSCPSTRNLSAEAKTLNRQSWVFGGLPCVAVIEDSILPVIAIAVFEKSGKVDNIATVHVVCHFDAMGADYEDRAGGWARIISRLFPADYPITAADVQLHSRIPGLIPTSNKVRQMHSGILAVMDFVHLSIAGEQFPTKERPDLDLCLRALLSEVAGMAARTRRAQLGSTEWDEGGQQQAARE